MDGRAPHQTEADVEGDPAAAVAQPSSIPAVWSNFCRGRSIKRAGHSISRPSELEHFAFCRGPMRLGNEAALAPEIEADLRVCSERSFPLNRAPALSKPTGGP